MKTFKIKNKIKYFLYVTLATVLFMACDSYPSHKVWVGKQNLVVYKAERITESKYGAFKYAITDATGRGWELVTFEEYQVGDTLKINK